MPQRTNEFQHLVALIERSLATADTRVAESKELTDNITGASREVDIVLERNDGVRDVVVSVECVGRSASRRATVEWVEQMQEKHRSLPTNKLVLVSKSGFTSTAKKKAAWLNIDALTLKEAQEYDWESVVRKVGAVKINSFLIPYVTTIRVVFEGEQNEGLDANDLDLPNSILYDPDGKAVGNPLNVANKWLTDPGLVRKLMDVAFTDAATVIEFERKFRRGWSLTDGKGTNRPVLKLQVEAKCRKEVSSVSLEQGSYGKAQIAHGVGTTFGEPAQIVLVQKQDREPQITISVRRNLRLHQ